MSAETLSLFDPPTVRCVFCSHVEESFSGDPIAMHMAMEAHYGTSHGDAVARTIGAPERVIVVDWPTFMGFTGEERDR